VAEWTTAQASLVPAWVGAAGTAFGLVLIVIALVALRRQQNTLRAAARLDHLTGMGNRKALEEALTEAAANVVKHSGANDKYEVHVVIENTMCEIRVVDTGRGFDSATLDVAMAAPSAEQGRGMALMAALVDSVRFESRPEAGTVVHQVKDLSLRPDGPLERLVGS